MLGVKTSESIPEVNFFCDYAANTILVSSSPSFTDLVSPPLAGGVKGAASQRHLKIMSFQQVCSSSEILRRESFKTFTFSCAQVSWYQEDVETGRHGFRKGLKVTGDDGEDEDDSGAADDDDDGDDDDDDGEDADDDQRGQMMLRTNDAKWREA